ncbi:MAG: tRNA (adenosine(37)-N6)-threonylcarbamoyltransferase complex dimerization subunit type 1 TsaB [Pseudomonadota bacterium]
MPSAIPDAAPFPFLLALDTSGPACSVAVADCSTGQVVGSKTVAMDRGHAEAIIQIVGGLLSECSLSFDRLCKVAVCIGPGSFAGLRVGLSAAKGYALAQNCQLVGISAFDAHAKGAPPAHRQATWIALDGRRGEVFMQRVDEPASATRLNLADLSDFDFQDSCIYGPFAAEVATAAHLAGDRAIASPRVADIREIARLGLQADAAIHPANLNYMRGADAKPGAGFSIRRAV